MTAAASRTSAVLVTPVLPVPGASGRAWRAWDWLQELARDHRVHVIVCDPDARPQPPPVGYPAESVHWLGGLTPTRRFALLAGLAMPPLVAWSRKFAMGWMHRPASASGLADARAIASSVSRVLAFRLYTYDIACSLAREWGSPAVELDLDDLESATHRSVAAALWRLGRPLQAAIELSASLQYWMLEKRLSRQCARIWLAADEDCNALRHRLPNASIGIRPNRIRAVAAPRTALPATLRLIFVGTLDYPPNEEGALWLAEHVVPRLRSRLGRGWGVDIAGRNPSARLAARLARCPEVMLRADVPELGPLYADATIALVPLRAGGGTKLKTLEAVQHGCALVSTQEGVRGLGLRDDEHCLLAESPTAFADAIVRLASDMGLANRLAAAARDHLAVQGLIGASPPLAEDGQTP